MNVPNVCSIRNGGLGNGGPLTEEERHTLEKKLNMLMEWVGVWIPDEVELDGIKVPLHRMVWELVKKKHLTGDDESLLFSLEEKLSKRFRFDLEKIDALDMTQTQAMDDYCDAVGLLRAIVTLKDLEAHEEKTLGVDDIRQRIQNDRTKQAKKWLDFLRQMGY